MFCDKCGKDSLVIQYEVSHKVETMINAVEHFDSLELAESYFERVIKTFPNFKWELEEIKICNDCDYLKTKILIKEEV